MLAMLLDNSLCMPHNEKHQQMNFLKHLSYLSEVSASPAYISLHLPHYRLLLMMLLLLLLLRRWRRGRSGTSLHVTQQNSEQKSGFSLT